MANSTVQAVSPRITMMMDLDEAKALEAVLEKIRGDRHLASTPWSLESIYTAVSSGVDDAEKIIKGTGYVG